LERSLGSSDKFVTPNEKETYMLQRRCLRVARDVKAGEIFTAEMLEPLRPAMPGALMAWDAPAVVGKKALVDMPYGKELRWSNISE
jgi:sialic acid synthase SpsE